MLSLYAFYCSIACWQLTINNHDDDDDDDDDISLCRSTDSIQLIDSFIYWIVSWTVFRFTYRQRCIRICQPWIMLLCMKRTSMYEECMYEVCDSDTIHSAVSVCLFVRLSRSRILSKRVNIFSIFFPRDTLHKRELCRGRCLSVCSSICHTPV